MLQGVEYARPETAVYFWFYGTVIPCLNSVKGAPVSAATLSIVANLLSLRFVRYKSAPYRDEIIFNVGITFV